MDCLEEEEREKREGKELKLLYSLAKPGGRMQMRAIQVAKYNLAPTKLWKCARLEDIFDLLDGVKVRLLGDDCVKAKRPILQQRELHASEAHGGLEKTLTGNGGGAKPESPFGLGGMGRSGRKGSLRPGSVAMPPTPSPGARPTPTGPRGAVATRRTRTRKTTNGNPMLMMTRRASCAALTPPRGMTRT